MKHGKTRRPRILVVENKQLIALTQSAILEIAGYEVETAFSGEDAVEKAATFHPDLLLIDTSMGAMNSIDAAVRITAAQPGCRVMFLTGHASMNNLFVPSPECLVFSVVSKPAHVPDVLNAIAYMLPAATAVRDTPSVETEHDPMQLHSLARAALARLDAHRMERPNRPSQAPEIGRAAGGARQRAEMACRPSTLAANGEGWFDSHRPPVGEAQRVRPLVRVTSLA